MDAAFETIVFRALSIKDVLIPLRAVFPSLPDWEEWEIPSARRTFAGHIIRVEQDGWFVTVDVELRGGGALLARQDLVEELEAGGFAWESDSQQQT